MSVDPVRELINKRRDKSIAVILSMKDNKCDEFLPSDVSQELRKIILDQFNDFAEICNDVLNSYSTETVVLNEHYLNKIDEIHGALNA